MTESKQPMESPSGLDLHPDPPATARISKKVGVAVLGVVIFVGVLVVYGLYARQEQQQVTQAMNEEKHPESAQHIGDQLVKELAPPVRCKSSSGIFRARHGRSPTSKWWNAGTELRWFATSSARVSRRWGGESARSRWSG